VAAVIGRAGVSRKTFYEQFRDREDCVLAAYDAILARFLAT
jgi:AcrR family transcriptional regulator